MYLRGTARSESAKYVVPQMQATTGKVLASCVGRKKVEWAAEEDLLASAFDTAAGVAVHLVNITDVLPKDGETVAHYDPVKPYCKGAAPCGEVRISLETARSLRAAVAYTPEKPEGISLALSADGGRVQVTVPAGFFAGYCLIELESV